MVYENTRGIDAVGSNDPANPGVFVRILGRRVVLVECTLDTGGYAIAVWDPSDNDPDPVFTLYTSLPIEPL